MVRVYIPAKNISFPKITISDKEQLHHLKDVLRLKEGEGLIAFDNRGNEYLARVARYSNQEALLKVEKKLSAAVANKIQVSVACAIPKRSKLDDIIDKLTQLGVARIIPLKTERVIVRLDTDKERKRYERWKKIALAAAEQSQRSSLPVIEPVRGIREVLKEARDFDLKLIPTLLGSRRPLKQVLGRFSGGRILVLIGPEGDFTPQEVKLAEKEGFIPVTLGGLVLRVETAALNIISIINYVFGE